MDQRHNKIKVIPVVETLAADLLTPLGVYLKLSANTEHSFLLESVEGGKSLARYSFIGANPENVVSGGRETFEALREHFSLHTVAHHNEMPPFIGGAIGCIGFEACEWFEPSLERTESDNDLCSFMFYRSVVAFDHAKQVIKIISLAFADDPKNENDLIAETQALNIKIRNILEWGTVPLPIADGSAKNGEIRSNWKREDFESAVSQIKELIYAGDAYQVVLSQCFTKQTTASPVSIYRAVRSLNPSPYMFLLQFKEKAVVGASPEMLVKCKGDRIEYRPIAGTRPRGKNAAADDALAAEMQRDKKEVAEHLMLVDLGRNDLGRVAEYGSVSVDVLMNVEKYSHVQHLISALSAKIRLGLDRFDALAACFPAGTVSGAPKVRALQIIKDLEPDPRGIYAGAVGYFDYAGNMDTCIAIRTLVLENGEARVQAGAGIVADSVPELEFEETVNKAQALLRAIEIAEGKAA